MTHRRRLAVLLLVALVMPAAACGNGIGPAPSPATRSTDGSPIAPVHSATPTDMQYTMTGTALGATDNAAISGVTVGLKLATASTTCQTCGFYSAVTGYNGVYSIQIPNGVYVAACSAGTLTCRFADAPTQATVRVTISDGDLTANIVISAPQPSGGDDQGGGGASSDTVTGHVYTTSGRPVSNATVEFRKAACPDCMPQPWTTTDASGAYSITLDEGVYNVECPDPNGCRPKGSNGGPFPITVPRSGPVDFVVR